MSLEWSAPRRLWNLQIIILEIQFLYLLSLVEVSFWKPLVIKTGLSSTIVLHLGVESFEVTCVFWNENEIQINKSETNIQPTRILHFECQILHRGDLLFFGRVNDDDCRAEQTYGTAYRPQQIQSLVQQTRGENSSANSKHRQMITKLIFFV